MAPTNEPRPGSGFAISEQGRIRYQQLLSEQLAEVGKGIAAGDIAKVRELAHRIRGSAALFGMADLGEACRALEIAAIEGAASILPAWTLVLSIHGTYVRKN